jgi:hypothetical protein
MHDGAVSAGGFAEAAAMLAAAERAELAIDEGNQLAREIVGVVSDRRRVDVLIAAQSGEAIREDEDRRAHLALVHQSRDALGDVVAERAPAGVRHAGAGEADEVEEDGEAAPATAALAFVVLRRKPHAEPAHVRVAERIAFQDLRGVLENDERAGPAGETLDGHLFSQDD